MQQLIPEYVQSVCEEISFLSNASGDPLAIHTMYIGGGTPSILAANELGKIIDTANNRFYLSPSIEITLEANPGTVTEGYLKEISAMGVNRVSLGMQSADEYELSMLQRQHSHTDVIRAVECARKAGIGNVSLDLIYGLPGQTIDSWRRSVGAALVMQTEHLSLYALTLEHGTSMQHQVEIGMLPEPDPDLAADMYEVASEQLTAYGFVQYEISNWARQDDAGELYSCKHNLQYWRNLPYLGVGAGAHGFIASHRTVDVLTPGVYIKRMSGADVYGVSAKFPRTPATMQCHRIDTVTEIGETMMMGLRLVSEGVSNQEFDHRFGMKLENRFSTQIEQLIRYGLLEWVGAADDRLRLTKKGYLLGNQVFMEFI
ncbi:MAG: radical SAM family heme chaperone HemW [Anaerolineae bacterium]|nr:radical SAM family heme chaperone HemW [Anaerolineae bacterium]